MQLEKFSRNKNGKAGKPKVAFLLSDQLGWRTYAQQLLRVAAQRDDVDFVFKLYSFPTFASPFLKWANSNKSFLGKFKQTLDPITFAKYHLRSWWLELEKDPSIVSVHVASHILAGGVLSYTSLPYTIALDATRPCVSRGLFDVHWTESQIAREKVICSSASHIYPMSGWAENSVLTDFSCFPSRSTIIPPSGFISDFPQPRSFTKSARPKVVFIGNDLYRKGGDKLIKWAQGPLRNEMELHIISQALTKDMSDGNIKIHGARSNKEILNEILPTMDIFCLPTQQDMSPQVLMEAALSQIPSIATNVGGISEMIINGKTGFVVPKNNDTHFLNALTNLIKNNQLRFTMGRAARLHAESKMNADKNFNKLIENMLAIQKP